MTVDARQASSEFRSIHAKMTIPTAKKEGRAYVLYMYVDKIYLLNVLSD